MREDIIEDAKTFLDSLDWDKVKPFRGIVLHHSATPDDPVGYSWGAIKRFHTSPEPEGHGWTDVGYHFGIELVDGKPVFLKGRSLYEYGAHALHYNAGQHACIGICLVGSFDKNPPTEDEWNRLLWLCMELRRQLLKRRGVQAFVIGHRETYAPNPPQKTCPGTAFDLTFFRHELERIEEEAAKAKRSATS